MATTSKQSPFSTHRDKVLGHYGTASFLRAVVLALWNGNGYKVGLSSICNLDQDHYAAFLEMIGHYRNFGESDRAFMALAKEVEARVAEEKRAAERAEDFEAWCREICYEIRQSGGAAARSATDLVDEHYSWLDNQFGNLTVEGAAAELVRRHQAAG